MNTANYVDQLVNDLKSKGTILSDAAWETALACVGWPYVYGAWGAYCTITERKRRYREDHPTIKTSCQVYSGKKSECDGCKWYPNGERVRCFDCRGFTDWVLKQFGIDLDGEGATSQWNTASNWETKGTIDTIPDNVLVCLFVQKNGKMQHTGLGYNGQTCECSSGVQHFTTRNKKWTHWAKPRGIGGNVPAPTPTPDAKPTLRKGDKGPYVTLAQTDLINKGYKLPKYGADGDFGNETLAAVKKFQLDHGLEMDGVIGPATWAALESTEPEPQLYTVHIPMLPKFKAEAIISQYSGAWMTAEGSDA